MFRSTPTADDHVHVDMNAYQNALAIATDTSGSRLDLARELLRTGEAVVLLEHTLALRSDGQRIICEVITRLPEIAAARAVLEASTIRGAVKAREHEWIVVDDDGMGTFQLWPKRE